MWDDCAQIEYKCQDVGIQLHPVHQDRQYDWVGTSQDIQPGIHLVLAEHKNQPVYNRFHRILPNTSFLLLRIRRGRLKMQGTIEKSRASTLYSHGSQKRCQQTLNVPKPHLGSTVEGQNLGSRSLALQ